MELFLPIRPMTSPKPNHSFVFFGTDEFAVRVLERLGELGWRPSLIITTEDKPRGRGQELAPSPVKLWATKNKIPFLQPENLKLLKLALVASYGKIIPAEILAWPRHGILNIHPSLLPKYRGPTPIQSAILAGEAETGVTIMLMDEKIDHGSLLKARGYKLEAQSYSEARGELAELGAELFVEIAPDYLAGKIKPEPQDHSQATFTKKIKKEDGLINLNDDPKLNYQKFLAYQPWPGVYFFGSMASKRKPGFLDARIIITAAHLDTNGQFAIDRVKPEGKKEMSWADFQRGLKN